MFMIEDGEGWKTAALEPGKQCEMLMEGDNSLWLHGGRRKREANEANKIPIAPGVTTGQWRRALEHL